MKQLKILVATSNTNGCFYHRLLLPHSFLEGAKCDIAVIDEKVTVADLDHYDIVVTHNPVKEVVDLVKRSTAKLVVDCDDYWYLSASHPYRSEWERKEMPQKIEYALKNADLVTTTTDSLANKIAPFNRCRVLPNALTYYVPQFQVNKVAHNKVRFGLVGGCSHLNDIKPVCDAVKYLQKSYLNKCQFVLSGFANSDIWRQMERMLTNDYKICSNKYKEYLLTYSQLPYDGDLDSEPYIRVWWSDVTDYAYIYDNIDVLIAPLKMDTFVNCKSELKIVEAGFKNVAVIVGNVPQYRTHTNKVCDTYTDYLKYIKHYIDNPDEIKADADILTEKITEKYDLLKVNARRLECYKQLLNKNIK